MNKRERKLSVSRDHIAHVIPDLKLSGCLCLATKIAHELRKQYQHTLIFETPLLEAQSELYYQVQGYGMDVLQTDLITPASLEENDFTGVILYNVTNRPSLGGVMPSIYYSYGIYDEAVGGVAVACSEYACDNRRSGPAQDKLLDRELIVPPMVSTREWRRIKTGKHPFTVGILTSGAYNKYPCRVVMELLGKIPKDVTLLITTLPRYSHMGVQLAIDARKQECKNTFTCSPIFGATLRYLASCDILVYASSDDHYEPYGRLVVEAMALGKPVVCENRGVFQQTLEHGVNAFLFNTTDEIIEYINRIRGDSSMVALLGANAQMWASWQDTTVHIGKLKRVLREVGI